MTKERVCYRMRGTAFAWGCFGDILVGGFPDDPRDPMIGHPVLDPAGKALIRTGPFVPPISFPIGYCLVTDSFRKELESSGLRGLAFATVLKHHIVELHWEDWDRTKELEPWQLPESGPEGYLLDHPHSPETAAAMDDLWLLTPPGLPHVWDGTRAYFERSVVGDNDFFFMLSSSGSQQFASPRAKEWLEQRVAEWITFEPFAIVD